ncbi:MAG: hypothetical protein JOZ54_23050 [Acidobacteria bacterium]|nr:hypothetical protein [Acidobacteriota bacterium]
MASILTGAATIAALVGTSAFAEDRPANQTGRERIHVERSRGAQPSQSSAPRVERRSAAQNDSYRRAPQAEVRRAPQPQAQQSPSYDRSNINRNDSRYDNRNSSRNDHRYDNNNRNYNNNRNDNGNRNNNDNRWRNDNRYDNRNRNYGYNRNNNNYNHGRYDNRNWHPTYGRYDRSRPYYYSGRISRYERYGSGFRVWIIGAPYPFFIPEVRFRSYPFRVGLDIRLGGYYNSLGYYDYYDAGPIGTSYAYTNGDLRGVVESVDYRNGTVVIRDDISGDFVTTVLRTRDRLADDLRPGDYVELTGAWTRGVFEAYRVASLDAGAYRQ